MPVLTPEEQKMVNDFATKIDIENTNQILQYGAGTQKKMADFSDTALENVKTQDLGEIGELISNVVGELKDFDVQEEGKFFGFFKKQTSEKQICQSTRQCGEDHRFSSATSGAPYERFCYAGQDV